MRSPPVLSEFEEKHAGGGTVGVARVRVIAAGLTLLETLWVMPCVPCLTPKPSCGAPCSGQVRETRQSFVLKQP